MSPQYHAVTVNIYICLCIKGIQYSALYLSFLMYTAACVLKKEILIVVNWSLIYSFTFVDIFLQSNMGNEGNKQLM